MDFTTIDIMWLIVGVLAGVIGPIMGYKSLKMVVMSKSDTKASLRAQIEDLKQLVEHHKKESSRWRGRMGQMVVKPTVEDGDPTKPDEFIPDLIKQYAHMAPDWMKPFLKDEGMIKFLIEQAKNNPDAAKSILSKFIGRPKDKNPATEPKDQQQAGIDRSEYA